MHCFEQESAIFSVKGQIANGLGFVSCMVSVVTTRLFHGSEQAAMDNM